MATHIPMFNNLNFNAMKKNSSTRKGNTYHEEGIGTVTVLLAAATVFIIFYSIYSSI